MNTISAIPQNWQKTLFRTLLAFTLGATVVSLVGEAFKTHLIWYMRFTDFIDLIINMSLYLVSLILFYELFLQARASRRLRTIFMALALLFMFGQAMHVSTNAVNTFATEIRKYQDLPQDMYALLYFFDETLSHLIVDISQYSLFACLMIMETRYLASQATARSQGGALTAGVFFGIWEAITLIEGQKLILAPFVLVGLGGLWIWQWRRSKETFGNYLRNGPVTAFFGSMLPCLLCGLGIYLISFGSFTEPSKLQIGLTNLIPLGVFLVLVAAGALIMRFGHRPR